MTDSSVHCCLRHSPVGDLDQREYSLKVVFLSLSLSLSSDEINIGHTLETTYSIAGKEFSSDFAIAVRIVITIAKTNEIIDECPRIRATRHWCLTVNRQIALFTRHSCTL
jgi:hypothetical protein